MTKKKFYYHALFIHLFIFSNSESIYTISDICNCYINSCSSLFSKIFIYCLLPRWKHFWWMKHVSLKQKADSKREIVLLVRTAVHLRYHYWDLLMVSHENGNVAEKWICLKLKKTTYGMEELRECKHPHFLKILFARLAFRGVWFPYPVSGCWFIQYRR